ncbi:nitrous oxide reductase family maturation protein NosD [Halomarina pelagica]|uniref:nitrous oxide reductase family maturation protein NosD n=1 Tax=Halomarina pelagica TaxID=2961599 RepID=UPI0020C29115|nr:nitrous oxide reductase family maturation protein NosD [Halomarina sp. BND7]
MNRTTERWFAVVAVAVLVASGAAVAAGPTQARSGANVAFDPPVPDEYSFDEPAAPGRATVDGRSFDSVQEAVDSAEPGDTVRLRGRFDEDVVVNASNLTLVSEPGQLALIDGTATGDVLTLNGENVTVRRVWVRNSGFDPAGNDAGIWVNGTGARIVDSRVTAITFGIWIDGVDGVVIENNTIVGRESVRPLSYRGNGIQVWKTEDSLIADNRITDVRDGVYFSWASNVTARNNAMWDLRYGVHYMYSDDCRLANNTAFDNDVGYALMLSENIRVANNTAVNNTGTSGHGILLKRIDHSVVEGNEVVANGNGLYVFNSVNNTIAGNLVLENRVGIYLTAGSVDERVYGNSFINNGRAVRALVGELATWNASDRGNYWSDARRSDVDHDGVNEIRHRPAGLVDYLVYQHPQATVFASSPAFDALRRAESAFPVIDAPGVVDYHPLADPPHDDWRRYYARNRR